MKAERPLRHLVIVLGDQLDAGSSAFDGFDARCDAVWMAEVASESTIVWSHKARTAYFLSAMRHFRDTLCDSGIRVCYRKLDDRDNLGCFQSELEAFVRKRRPNRLIVVEPGEWRVRKLLEATARRLRLPLDIRVDRHFLCSAAEFSAHAPNRRQLRMEHFYRGMRRRLGILMDGDRPVGGSWNFDAENRGAFGRSGPGEIRPPRSFRPDSTTRDVISLVERRFASHPGSLAPFDWPVTREQALAALRDFIEHRLPGFGRVQDAMWMNEPYLYHSRLSAAMNLKLLDPRETIAAAEAALRAGHAPLAAVEGFIRQILGWREYVRGVYWLHMPDYLDRNALDAEAPLPDFYWTGETEMQCLRHCISQTLSLGYAHHIQRLMVTGLFALLLGVRPQEVHAWYLGMYVDAVEWVELPNTLGMSQYADGGIMASKPYVATGKYIQRMSNYCEGCTFDPAAATGPSACPFTTLYWDFLMRHDKRLRASPRMALQLRNLAKLSRRVRGEISRRADGFRVQLTVRATSPGEVAGSSRRRGGQP